MKVFSEHTSPLFLDSEYIVAVTSYLPSTILKCLESYGVKFSTLSLLTAPRIHIFALPISPLVANLIKPSLKSMSLVHNSPPSAIVSSSLPSAFTNTNPVVVPLQAAGSTGSGQTPPSEFLITDTALDKSKHPAKSSMFDPPSKPLNPAS